MRRTMRCEEKESRARIRETGSETNSSNPPFDKTVSHCSKTRQEPLGSHKFASLLLFPRHTLFTKLNDVGTINIFFSRGKSMVSKSLEAPTVDSQTKKHVK